MGLLVEAGDGYPVEPNMDVPKIQNPQAYTAVRPYAEMSDCGTDIFNEIRLIRTRAVRHNVSGQRTIVLQHRIQQRPTLRIQRMPVHNLKPAAIGIHNQNMRITQPNTALRQRLDHKVPWATVGLDMPIRNPKVVAQIRDNRYATR